MSTTLINFWQLISPFSPCFIPGCCVGQISNWGYIWGPKNSRCTSVLEDIACKIRSIIHHLTIWMIIIYKTSTTIYILKYIICLSLSFVFIFFINTGFFHLCQSVLSRHVQILSIVFLTILMERKRHFSWLFDHGGALISYFHWIHKVAKDGTQKVKLN